MLNIGINGFGRIGRAIFRINEKENFFNIAVINDIDPNVSNHAYLLKYDTTYGKLDKEISADDKNMTMKVNDKIIQFYSEKNIKDVTWEKHNIDVLIDASGVYENVILSKELILNKKVKKIIVTNSPKNGIDNTIIFGVNENKYDPKKHNILSASICDANASAPILCALNKEYEIEFGFITTMHPWLSYQNLTDGTIRSISSPGHFWTDFSLGRSSVSNLIPKETTLVSALEKVIPNISSCLSAMSFRVPTQIVTASDIVLRFKKQVSNNDLNLFFINLAKNNKKIIGYSKEPLVSIDFMGINQSVIIDGRWINVNDNKNVRIILWYDNEWGYSNRVLDLVSLIESFL